MRNSVVLSIMIINNFINDVDVYRIGTNQIVS